MSGTRISDQVLYSMIKFTINIGPLTEPSKMVATLHRPGKLLPSTIEKPIPQGALLDEMHLHRELFENEALTYFRERLGYSLTAAGSFLNTMKLCNYHMPSHLRPADPTIFCDGSKLYKVLGQWTARGPRE